MSKLQLILLGRFECLLSSGTRISLPMRKAEVLLAYLALTPGLRHPRERLINLLWSDRGEEQARNSLRQCLSAIRKSLGDAAELALLVDRSTVSLQPGLIEVDVLEFERLADIGDYESLATAADLYQGEFLEGIAIRDAACQEWLDSERSRFKRQFIEILLNLAETQLVSHDFGHAIKSAERLVKQDPLGESGWRLLMRSYFENGDRAHALQAFKRCQQAMRDELEVEPETATIELRDQIAGGETKPTSTATTVKSTITPSSRSDHSIAVLPFDNLSGDPEQEYFSDGITDSIILNLSLFPGLNVKSRNSSFAFKQQIKSLGEISKELGVDYIVEGNIRRSEQHVRITVQLIEANGGNQIWGKRYDAGLTDLFELEEELSRAIAATVTGQIESELQRVAIAKGAAGQESYDLLLSGIYHNYRFNRQDTVIAIEKLNQCLALDPDNVRAHKQLYTCHLMNYLERWTDDYQASFELAAEHIEKALALAPESAMVLVFYAQYLVFRGEFDQAAPYLDKALAINPNDPHLLATQALSLEIQGEAETALLAAERACQLDPYHPWAEWEVAVSQYISGQYELTLETISKSRTSPGFIQIFGIASSVKLSKTDLARQALRAFLQKCREDMLSMPTTQEEWLQYTRENYPFKDPRINHELIDCLLKAGLEDEFTPRAATPESTGYSIAVLPFDNLSGDPEQEYFSDGITDSIILNLSLFPGLKVKSRNSSFAFKQQIKSPGEISQELDVDYIVEGSIRRSTDRIRITVQLIQAASSNQIWGKRYDAEIDNLFDLEEELSRTIAATVTGQIESELQRIAIAKGAAGQQAYDLLLSGTYHFHRFTRQDTAIAIDKLNQCLAQDPDNVRAHVVLCGCHDMDYLSRWTEDHEASFEMAERHIRRAMELDPGFGPAQVYYGEFLTFKGELDKAAIHLDKALEINPNDTDALTTKAMNLQAQCKFDNALKLAEQVLALDPYHPWAEWELAGAQYFCGRYDKALATISNFRTSPGFVLVYAVAANLKLGRIEAAQQALQAFLQDCRENMLSMPRSIDEWYEYTRDNYRFRDSRFSRDLVDSLVQAGLEEELVPSSADGKIDDLPAVLVLPFSNLSGDPEQEYFSDGITDSIIVSLSTFDGLKVKSRHTSNAFRESTKSIDEIGAELGVRYVVEGSVRKIGDNVRITVQLDDTASGDQVWGKRFDAPLEDLFSLEEELVQTIAGTVSGRIGHETRISSMRKPAKDLRSYDYLMRGTHHLEKFNADDSKIAKEEFSKCLEIDPRNAEAHAQLAVTHSIDLFENWTDDRPRSIDEAAHHLNQAIQLEPENAYTHAYLAEHQLFTRDFKLGLFHADKSIELNPTLPDGYSVKSYLLAITGQIEAALTNADTSMKIDPYSYYMGWNAGEVYRIAGQYQRAVDTFRSIPHMSPSVHAETAACLVALDRLTEARTEMQLFRQQAREQMATYPQTEAAWRKFWYETTPYQNDADFDLFYGQLMQAGLCDDIEEISNDMPSIAVLPFENMSGDPDQEYFSDGITTGIILSLGMFKGLSVKSQRSSFAFKNSVQSSKEIGEILGVDYLVEGSIRKSGNKVRISAQLVEAAGGNQVWGKQYNAEAEDVLNLEQELSQTIAATISGRVGHRLQHSAVRKQAKNLKSYDFYLRGLYHFGKFTPEDFAIAADYFAQCIKIDPDHAEAHMQIGMIHQIYRYENWTEDQEKSRKVAEYHLRKAVKLEPDNAWVHAYLTESLLDTGDLDQAEYHADKAIELNPNSSEAQAAKAQVAMWKGCYEEALECARLCVQLDPYSSGAAWVAGEVYLICAEYEKSVKTFRSIENPPNVVRAMMAAGLAGMGQLALANREMQLFLANARKNMPSYLSSTQAWREFWGEYLPFRFDEDSTSYFDLMLTAGLCDDMAEPTDDMPSIAVLPFENMSGDPEQEHFSDGITADIIDTLSRFRHMRTVSRYSTLPYKIDKPTIAEIAAQQGVRYILEGSVRKSGDRIRVNVELIDSNNEQILWSKRFDRDLDDLFAVQDELTQNITLAMKVQLDDGEMARLRSKGTSNTRAWELIMTAVDLQDTYIRQNILDARTMAEEAISLDPEYPYAWISLGWTHWQEAYSGWSQSIEDSNLKAEQANRRARDLDPDYAEVWSQMGMIHLMRHEAEDAIEDCLRAVELEPGSAEIQGLTAFSYVFAGDYEQAKNFNQNMIRLSPVRANWNYLIEGQIEVAKGNLDRAAEFYRQGLEVEPESPLCRYFLIDLMMQTGNEAAARQYADEIRALDKSVSASGIAHTYSADPSLRDAFRARLAKYDLA